MAERSFLAHILLYVEERLIDLNQARITSGQPAGGVLKAIRQVRSLRDLLRRIGAD